MFRLCSAPRRLFSLVKSFSNLETLNGHLAHEKKPFVCVYFRAGWNPYCQQSDAHATQLAAQQPGLQVIRIDCDESPKIKKHYDVRAEPQYVFCLYGDEVVRQTGVSLKGLKDKYAKMVALSQEPEFGELPEKWLPYGSNYKLYYEELLKYRSKFINSDL